jgi:ketosteroid isomerase-like protein
MAIVQDLTDPRVVAAIKAYFDTLSRQDRAGWLALFCEDAVVHQPVGAVPAEGVETLGEVWQMLTGPFERLRTSEDSAFYAGSGAAVKWTTVGRSSQGREVRFEGINVFEIAPDGLIQTLMAYWDPAAMLIELAGGP